MWTYHINKANVTEGISGLPFVSAACVFRVSESPPLSPTNTQLLTGAADLVRLQCHSQEKTACICSRTSDRSSSP